MKVKHLHYMGEQLKTHLHPRLETFPSMSFLALQQKPSCPENCLFANRPQKYAPNTRIQGYYKIKKEATKINLHAAPENTQVWRPLGALRSSLPLWLKKKKEKEKKNETHLSWLE